MYNTKISSFKIVNIKEKFTLHSELRKTQKQEQN